MAVPDPDTMRLIDQLCAKIARLQDQRATLWQLLFRATEKNLFWRDMWSIALADRREAEDRLERQAQTNAHLRDQLRALVDADRALSDARARQNGAAA